MCPPVEITNRNTLMFNHNKTLNKKNSYDYWIFLAESHWNATKANLLDLFNSF